ncbi:hypothetical protein [Oceanirhabdus sp. W0125-5]|uniref:hypothetical protein n=1 Tax=Oceanirhabdus sp. W0125-5 TaxID=2999116 RepID=UPI0022F31745|nr:hypothetical protein [Oceanirhabdus sp. W0125-5]WBW96819.1 hypothetical protein OW730_24485 [Oceanirhabdus sp. W0125-5]
MKKILIMSLLLISVTVSFIGCGKNEEKLSKELVKKFAIEMYNQSCDELEKVNSSEYSFDVFKDYFTEEGFKNFENDKVLLDYYNYIVKHKKNIVFFDISYNEVIHNNDSISVRCTVSFNLMNKNLLEKNKTLIEELQNELVITLIPVDGKWKIVKCHITL